MFRPIMMSSSSFSICSSHSSAGPGGWGGGGESRPWSRPWSSWRSGEATAAG
ncbi:hypothetical protein EYF80_043317 [Liparis tanakae]|uniref:Uncharacterized protein n=1 Tax=Liparis tanakae TaxID=230148 RepID=A0A4Z2FYX9_9TELE|nr:hypothetical protein EYF80_043317 [Liparis tanakae]